MGIIKEKKIQHISRVVRRPKSSHWNSSLRANVINVKTSHMSGNKIVDFPTTKNKEMTLEFFKRRKKNLQKLVN